MSWECRAAQSHQAHAEEVCRSRAGALPRGHFVGHAERPMTEKALERLPISMSTSPW